MKADQSALPSNAHAEISALIETLHKTEQRLEELTGGQVDTVMNRVGDTVVLRHAQERLRHVEAEKQAAILNALPAHIAVLDANGKIVSVNAAWRHFSEANDRLAFHEREGRNYLARCDRAPGNCSADAKQIAKGIRAVLAGKLNSYSIEYSGHSSTQQRWFLAIVTPLGIGRGKGAIVMHVDITERRKAEGTLKLSEFSVSNSSSPTYWINADGCIQRVNRAACELLGYTQTELLDMVIGDIDAGLAPGQWLSHWCELRERKRMSFESRYRRKDGSTFPVEVDLNWFEFEGHEITFAFARDITERKNAAERIKHLNRLYAVLSGINTLIVRVRDRDELFKQACAIAVDQGGFRIALIGMLNRSGTKLLQVAMSGGDAALVSAINQVLAGSKGALSPMTEQAIREKQPSVSNDSPNDARVSHGHRHVEYGVRSMAVLPLIVADQAVGALALYASDTDFFHAEEMKLLNQLAGDISFAIDHIDQQGRLEYLAYYDALTGLANQALFIKRVQEKLEAAGPECAKVAVFVGDIERFRNINEAFGRQAGDDLLKQVAGRLLKHGEGAASRFARLGADRFAIVAYGIEGVEQIGRYLKQRMDATFGEPFLLHGNALRVSIKVGVAIFPADGGDADTLLRNAETALSKAKGTGERYVFFAGAMTARVVERLRLEHQLRSALENGEYVLHYQPKVSVASGKVTGVEALIRWNDPRSGLVLPGQFIPVLEETGLIREVGRWALRKSIEDYLRWRAAGLNAVRIAVNVSPLQLRHHEFIAEIAQALSVDADAAAGLEIEITENAIIEDVGNSIADLHAIRKMGVHIAIDDFGTGFSSLSYLAKLPVDTLKIDRTFVTEMTVTPQGRALVTTIINLAHSLKLKVVAEGVETEEQAHLLQMLSCDETQGYLFSKPLPCDVLETKYLSLGREPKNSSENEHGQQ